MDIAGQPVPVDLRMPGYPAFLAHRLRFDRPNRRKRAHFRNARPGLVDLACCWSLPLWRLSWHHSAASQAKAKRAFLRGLWLAALCPFTANYVAVPLTEVWAIVSHCLAFVLLVLLARMKSRADFRSSRRRAWTKGTRCWKFRLLLRDSPSAWAPYSVQKLRCFWSQPCSCWVSGCGAAASRNAWFCRLASWLAACPCPSCPGRFATREPSRIPATGSQRRHTPRANTIPKDSWRGKAPGCTVFAIVIWCHGNSTKNQSISKIFPDAAFDTPEEKERVATVLETYNDDLSLNDGRRTPCSRNSLASAPLAIRCALISGFLCGEPCASGSRRASNSCPSLGHVFPLAYMREEDPVDQRVTILLFRSESFLRRAGDWGGWKFWNGAGTRPQSCYLLFYIVVRTAF